MKITTQHLRLPLATEFPQRPGLKMDGYLLRSTSTSSSRHLVMSQPINERDQIKPSPLDDGVPSDFQDVCWVFLRHPTPLGTLSGLLCIALYRLNSPLSWEDLTVVGVVGLFWIFQEWFMHKYLLHANIDWIGRRIHVDHHKRPYHHVCIDDPKLVYGMMVISAVILKLLFGNQPVGDTAIFSYWFMGLVYLWCHFLVHTKYKPRNRLLRSIQQNHMKHHCKDSRYWFSFTCPMIDKLLNTTPS